MRRALAVAAVTATALVATACGSSTTPHSASSTTTHVNVGVIPIIDVAPIYLGKQHGFFTSRGIDLTMSSGQGGAAIVPGVVSGQTQFGFSNMTSLLVAQSQNVPITVVASGVASTGVAGADFGGVVVKAGSPIQSAKDLVGKKIAVNTLKNIGDTTVRESVRKAGGDPNGLHFVEIAFPQMPAALDAGQIDAAWLVEPQLSIVKSQGARVVAWTFVDTAPNLTIAAYFTSTQTAKSQPDLVKRFRDAINESMTYADGHPDEVRAVLSSYTQIDPSIRAAMTLPRWPTQINRASVETLATLGQRDGLFTKAPNVSQLLP